jgi:hypothetical protein
MEGLTVVASRDADSPCLRFPESGIPAFRRCLLDALPAVREMHHDR